MSSARCSLSISVLLARHGNFPIDPEWNTHNCQDKVFVSFRNVRIVPQASFVSHCIAVSAMPDPDSHTTPETSRWFFSLNMTCRLETAWDSPKSMGAVELAIPSSLRQCQPEQRCACQECRQKRNDSEERKSREMKLETKRYSASLTVNSFLTQSLASALTCSQM